MKRLWGDVLAGVFFIVFSIWIIWEAISFPAGGGDFPLFSAGAVILLAIGVIVKAVKSKAPEMREPAQFDFSWNNTKQYVIGLIVVGYWPLSFVLGYFFTTFLFLVLAAWLAGVRSVKTIAVTAIVLIPALYGLFAVLLQASLPEGILI
ncbi:MAG: tripartite tricarboxylate transporter TctB family protein [Rhodospirillales bacterium]